MKYNDVHKRKRKESTLVYVIYNHPSSVVYENNKNTPHPHSHPLPSHTYHHSTPTRRLIPHTHQKRKQQIYTHLDNNE